MLKNVSSGVPYFEHPSMTGLRDVNWESVRVFLFLVRAGSFRAAAAELGIAINTVRRHIGVLEQEMGAVLVARGATGVELTQEGRTLAEAAGRMEQASFDVRRFARSALSELSGTVRISITEGIGTFWVMPQLALLKRAYPRVTVDLICTMRPPDPGRMESDIGVQISRPTNTELMGVRLGRMHSMPFASADYLQTYGRPKSLKEVPEHKIVLQLAPQLFNDEVEKRWPEAPRDGFVSVLTNTSTAHYWAVASGAGLGMLPTYLWAMGAAVEPVEIEDLRMEFDIWMTYHPSIRQTPRIAMAVEWLKRIFDPRLFPWFRDEFLHPTDMVDAANCLDLPNFFVGSPRTKK